MDRIFATDIKGIVKANGSFAIKLLGLPYGGKFGGKDLHRQYFSPRTEFQMTPGDKIPAVYFHGLKAGMKKDPTPEFYGKAELMKFDKRGGWFEIIIDETKKHATRIYKAAVKKTLRGSAGSAGALWNTKPDGEFGLFVPGEMSLFEQVGRTFAINDLAVGMLRGLYKQAGLELPKGFQEEIRQPGKVKLVISTKLYKGTNKYEKLNLRIK